MIIINKYHIFYAVGILSILFVSVWLGLHFTSNDLEETNEITGMVLATTNDTITIQNDQELIYTFTVEELNTKVGDNVAIKYTGIIDAEKERQTTNVIDCTILPTSADDIVAHNSDDDIFSQFYILASDYLKDMTLSEKIGQLLLVRYPADANDAIKNYKVGGFTFYENDFRDKTKKEVASLMANLQKTSKIPLLTAVDEEGGEVVRVSSNPNLRSTRFSSSRELYNQGGFDRIKEDTIEKSALLDELGLNLNLAPVVDIAPSPTDYMYSRTLGEDTEKTSTYAKTVIEASKTTPVSYTLKHFPGYGSNYDTHYGPTTDRRTLEDIKANDLPPFAAGIAAGAEAILFSHNTIEKVDPDNPASLSSSIHNLLRGHLGFTGVAITDDLSMGATSSIPNAVEKAILAGNDLIMVTDYEESFNEIKDAVDDGRISENKIDELAHKIIAWKFYKGLMYENQK